MGDINILLLPACLGLGFCGLFGSGQGVENVFEEDGEVWRVSFDLSMREKAGVFGNTAYVVMTTILLGYNAYWFCSLPNCCVCTV